MRTLIRDFQFANPIYRNASVTFYKTSGGIRTNVLSEIYSFKNGSTQAPNPIKLDQQGRYASGVYIDEPTIAIVTGQNMPSHETGVIDLSLTGVSVTPFSESLLSKETSQEWLDILTFKRSGASSVERSLNEVFSESISVKDKGATGLGIISDTTAFTEAGSVATHVTVLVPGPATYLLNANPAPTGKVTWIIENGVTFTGAGAPYMSGSGAGRQYLDAATTATDFASHNVRRNANHTGGTPGYVNSAFRVDHYVSPDVTNFEWSITSQLDNSATAGENTSLYAVAIKRSGAGPTIGGVIDVEDESTNPTTSSVGLEVDHRCNGLDPNDARVALDIYGGRRNPSGIAAQISYGARIQVFGDPLVSFKTGYGFELGVNTQVAFDAAPSVTSIGGFKVKTDQAFIWSEDNTKATAHDGAGLALEVSGVKKLRLNDSGGIQLNDLRLNITGSFSTGSSTPALTANKPGASTAILTWAHVDVDGTQGCVAVYARA